MSYGSGVDERGRKRDKKKTVSEEGIMEINSRNGAPYGRERRLLPTGTTQHQSSRAELEERGAHVAPQDCRERERKGRRG